EAADVAHLAVALVEHVERYQWHLRRRALGDRLPGVEAESAPLRNRLAVELQRLLHEFTPGILLDRADVADRDGEESVEAHRVVDFGEQAEFGRQADHES